MRFLLRRETLFLAVAVALTAAAAVAYWFAQATVLKIAVAPKDGTEPALIQAFADALVDNRANVRLKITLYDDVRDSAAALQQGRADLAVVRPDVSLPENGLTLAILRDQAMIIAAPGPSTVTHFSDLGGKRLGFIAQHEADLSAIKTLLDYYGLRMVTVLERSNGTVAPGSVMLIPLEFEEIAGALAAKKIDAVIAIIAPASPRAVSLVATVAGSSKNRQASFVAAPESDAIIERFPRLQAVTMPAGLFGGEPKIPSEEVKTVGTSYRLMARSTLSRPVAANVTQHLFELRTYISARTEAGDHVLAPEYETTAAATSARLPNHPGAIDYFEREQQTFLERYEDWIYLLAFTGGGLGSAAAWVGQRLSRVRRERVDVLLDRLLDIMDHVRRAEDLATLDALAQKVDRVAVNVVRQVRKRETGARTMAAVLIAIDTVRSALQDRRRALEGGGAQAERRSLARATPMSAG